MRNSILVSVWVCAMALSGAAAAQGAASAQVSGTKDGVYAKSNEVVVKAKIVELDRVNRSVVLKGPKGDLFTLDVPPEAKNFGQVQVGDDLVVRYITAVAAKLEPVAKSTGIRERIESENSATAASGAMPAAAGGRMVEVLAVIQSVDRKARTATLRGVKRTVTVAVPKEIDIAKLKVGGEVRAVFVEAALISVERAPAAK